MRNTSAIVSFHKLIKLKNYISFVIHPTELSIGYQKTVMNYLEKVNGKLISTEAHSCKVPVCGNGIKEAEEECDDGNNLYGDGCSPVCSADKICGPDDSCSQLLLNDPRIIAGILANPLTNETNYQKILLKKIEDLETENTGYWDDYRKNDLFQFKGVGSYTDPDPKMLDLFLELYLQKVALMLYVESHQLVPWSILDYDDKNLILLLSDLFVDDSVILSEKYLYTGNYQASLIPYYNGDPLFAFNYIDELKTLYPYKKINAPKDLLDLIIIRMRDDSWNHWWHNGTEEMYQKYMAGMGTNFCDFACHLYCTCGGDLDMSLALYALLQSYNIPSKEIPSYLDGSHSGIYYPTLDLSMKGNNVFDTWRSGYIHGYNGDKPNLLPVDLTYDDYTAEYSVWMQEKNYCKRVYNLKRKTILGYLNQYNHPTGKYDVLYAYCYYSIQHATEETLLDVLTKPYTGCQKEDPGQETYQPPILTPEEIASWDAKLKASVICKDDWEYEVLS